MRKTCPNCGHKVHIEDHCGCDGGYETFCDECGDDCTEDYVRGPEGGEYCPRCHEELFTEEDEE
jgi:hypothetical protein